MRFTEAPRFLLQSFFNHHYEWYDETDSNSYLEGIISKTYEYFDLIVEKQIDVDHKNHYIIPFKVYTDSDPEIPPVVVPFHDEDDFIYVERYVSLETDATSGIVFDMDAGVYFKKSSQDIETRVDVITGEVQDAGRFDSYIRERHVHDLTERIFDFVSVQKPWLYLGKMYPHGANPDNGNPRYRIELWDMTRYAISCLPPHLQTSKIKTFFRLFFDQVYSRIYNKEKFTVTLMDALEVDLNYIDYIADLYGVELSRPFIDSIKEDMFDYTNRKNERRLREYVRELPNYLKRKGAYSSLYVVYKSSFYNTANKMKVYERWHQDSLYNGWPEDTNAVLVSGNDLLSRFIDFDYTTFYGSVPSSGCVSGYTDIISGKGFSVPIENCYIHKQSHPSREWFVPHNLNSWQLYRMYEVGDIVFPNNITSYICIQAHEADYTKKPGGTVSSIEPDTIIWDNYWSIEDRPPKIQPIIQCFDEYLNLINPKEMFSINANFCGLTFSENKTGYALLADNQYVNPILLDKEIHTHNLNQIAPIVYGYGVTLVEYNTDSISVSAAISLDSVTSYGLNDILLEHIDSNGNETFVIATSGDYFHKQSDYSDIWEIEHNLDSKAIVSDFYTSAPTTGWYITHGLDMDIIYQTVDRDLSFLPHNSANNPSNSMIEFIFDDDADGHVFIKEPDETISLPTSASWVVSYSASAGVAPIIQVYDDSYIEVDCGIELRSSDSVTITGASGDIIVEVAIPGYTELICDSKEKWFINHRLNSKDIITNIYTPISSSDYEIVNEYDSTDIFVQVFLSQYGRSTLDTGSPVVTTDTITISLSADTEIIVNSYHSDHTQSVVTHNQTTPSTTWWVQHNLNTFKLNARVYETGVGEVIADHLVLYDKNWIKIVFEEEKEGYVNVYLSENSFIPAFKVSNPVIEIVDENNIIITPATSTIGYVSCVKAGLKCTNLQQSSPYISHIVDRNNMEATFLPNAAGVAVLREIGQLTYDAGLVMSPHYRVEIDINCEPLGPLPHIVEEGIFEHFINALEVTRPACKYAHYSILVSPKSDFSTNQIDLYDERFENSEIYTYCCVDTSFTEGSFLHAQYTATTHWNITHNLYNWNVMVQCYDFDRNLIYPAEVKIVDENYIQVIFATDQRGFVMLLEASETFSTLVSAGTEDSWTIEHSLISDEYGVITDYYDYDRKQTVPSNINITSVDGIESLWYVPTLGYCRLHEYNYLHLQGDLSDTWKVEHNLAYDGVFIQCFDMDHNVIEPYNIKLNKYVMEYSKAFIRNCTVSFPTAMSGYVIVTAVGNTLTRGYILESIAAGGYVKCGSGAQTNTWNATLYNILQEEYEVFMEWADDHSVWVAKGEVGDEPLFVPANILTSDTVVFTEDVFQYYISGMLQGREHGSKDITEMGLYTAEDDLVFYTYVKSTSTQFFKTAKTDLKILYRIIK